MDVQVVAVLKQIKADHGGTIFLNRNRFNALLKDYTKGQYKGEILWLTTALDEGLYRDLLDNAADYPQIRVRYMLKFKTEYFWTDEQASFTIEAWAAVMGIAVTSSRQSVEQNKLHSSDCVPENNIIQSTRDPFETLEEYWNRIEEMDMVLVGQARLDPERYNIETGRFILEIDWNEWAVPLMKDLNSCGITISRDKARDLCQQKTSYPVLAGLTIIGEQVSIKELRLETKEENWEISSSFILHEDGYVQSVAFSPDGGVLASGSDNDTVRLWEVASGKHLCTLEGHEYEVNSVAFSPDGRLLATGSFDDTVRLWEAASGKYLRTLEGHEDGVNSVAFSPDGWLLATGSDDKTVRLWGAASGKHLRTLEGHEDGVNSVAFSPDGRLLVTGSDDKTVRLWGAASGKHLRTLEGHEYEVNSVAFSPDGRLLASGSDDKTVRLWGAASGKHLYTLEGHEYEVNSVAFSPDGRLLASGSFDDTVRLWEAASGKHLRTLKGHEDGVNSVAFSPDGRLLASGSDDKTVRLMSLALNGLPC